MSTRCNIGIIERDGTCRTVYCHWDGYPTGVGAELLDCYNDEQKARELVAGGSMSSIVTYGEDRKVEHKPDYYKDHVHEEWDRTVYENVDKAVEDFRGSDAEYLYMFDCKVGKWMVTGMSSRFGHHRYYKGKVWEDLEPRVKEDEEHESMAEDKEHYWKPPCRPVKNMYDMFSARGNMQQVMEYDLPIGLPLIYKAGYGCHGYSCCWIADKRIAEQSKRIVYTIIGYDCGDERERDGRPYWHRSTHDGHIYPYSEKFGVGYYFDDRFPNPRLMPKEDIVSILKEIEENERLEKEAEERRIAEENAKYEMGKLMFEVAMNKFEAAFKEKPKAVIVAELEEFDGDMQTDYYHTSVTIRIPLAFSRYEKRLAPEMVKAASESGDERLVQFSTSKQLRMDGGRLKDGWAGDWRISKYPIGDGGYLAEVRRAMADEGEILLNKY